MNPDDRMRSYLARVATGPHLSKDLSRDEARDGMAMILSGETDHVRAAVFLIALRMKRETLAEYEGALEALRDQVQHAAVDVDDLVELGEPYDGYLRHLPAAPFLPPVLAACGVRAYVHGCRELPPKRGVTAHRVLAAAGVDVAASVADAARAVAERGWAYVDVDAFGPALAGLESLRERIVKRPLLNTIEKLAGPLRARRNHLVIGYVHKGYDALLLGLARDAGYSSALVVKGIEGGVISSLTASSTARRFRGDGTVEELSLAADEVGVVAAERAPPVPDGVEGPAALAEAAAAAGLAALDGAAGPTRDALIHAGATLLAHAGVAATRRDAAERVREALDSGAARRSLGAS